MLWSFTCSVCIFLLVLCITIWVVKEVTRTISLLGPIQSKRTIEKQELKPISTDLFLPNSRKLNIFSWFGINLCPSSDWAETEWKPSYIYNHRVMEQFLALSTTQEMFWGFFGQGLFSLSLTSAQSDKWNHCITKAQLTNVLKCPSILSIRHMWSHSSALRTSCCLLLYLSLIWVHL